MRWLCFQLPAVRQFQTSAVSRDIDSAAKYIGAGAATVGVAGSGNVPNLIDSYSYNWCIEYIKNENQYACTALHPLTSL